jgi:hypothetical protein
MQKNAHGYVQESCTALNQAVDCLHHAAQTVEKPENRQRIEQSLQTLEQALKSCVNTEQILASE